MYFSGNIYHEKINIIIYFFSLYNCTKDLNDGSNYVPQTIEEVKASRDYYFTFYLNDELWFTRKSANLKKQGNNQTSCSFINKQDSDGDYGTMYIRAIRHLDINNEEEKSYNGLQYLELNIKSDHMFFPLALDTIPFHYFFNQGSTIGIPSIGFRDDFYPKEEILSYSPTSYFVNYRNIHYLKLDIDSVIKCNWNFEPDGIGNNDIIYGRIEGVFSNNVGDTIKITKGEFKVREGTWRMSSF